MKDDFISCRSKSRVWERLFERVAKYIHFSNNITIITGANAPFYESMKYNLLESIERYEPHANIIIWDLGLDEGQLGDLRKYIKTFKGKGTICLRRYPVETLPPLYSMENWNYAFKSYCVFHALKEVNTRYAFWLDAGCGLKGTLDAERIILRMYGFYSPFNSTDVKKLTCETVLSDFMDEKCHYRDKGMLSSGVVGFDMQRRDVIALAAQWYNSGRVQMLLAPDGSSLANHRYDQSILTLVYYSRYKNNPYLCRYLYNVQIHLNKN